MTEIQPRRFAAARQEPFVLFLIGMRINAVWKVHKWLPVFRTMPRMLRELAMQPELGYLGGHAWFGRTIILVQYWTSFEALEAYANARNHAHLPAWAAFNRNIGSDGTVGIWHETYEIPAGGYECVYANMPRFGLGKVSGVVPAHGIMSAARSRLRRPG